MDARTCYQTFGYRDGDDLLVVKEQHLADSNFVFAYLLRQALDNNKKVILVLTHNSLPHYECVAKKLGYNLSSRIQAGDVKIVDFQKIIRQHLDNPQDIFTQLRLSIQDGVQNFLQNPTIKIALFCDDYAHIQDCTPNITESVNQLNHILGSFYNHDRVICIVGLHIGDKFDKILSSDLEYSADCIIDVSLMKTGRSDDISGVIKVLRNRQLITSHYKVKENGVHISAPGNFLLS